MRAPSLLILLALAGAAHAGDGIEFSHRVTPDQGDAAAEPMAWHYRVLASAQDAFDGRAAAQAPGATLAFRLPKVAASKDGSQVELVRADRRIPLAMIANDTFTLVRDKDASQADAMVVANRNFNKGSYNEPVALVRSPGLPAGVRRMGDLRLACAAQVAMIKAEGFKVRAVLAATSLFGLDICQDTDIKSFDKPAGQYDTVTIEDGARRLVVAAKDKTLPRLGDKDWSDNARISYALDGHPVQ